MSKTIKDNYGDPITVDTTIAKRVLVTIVENENDGNEAIEASVTLEVNAALKLARAIIKYAVSQNDDGDGDE